MPKNTQENTATETEAPELADFSTLSEKDKLDLVSLTDEVAVAALSGILAGATSLEAVSTAARVVWFKLIPEYFAARDQYYAAVFGTEDDGEEDDAPE